MSLATARSEVPGTTLASCQIDCRAPPGWASSSPWQPSPRARLSCIPWRRSRRRSRSASSTCRRCCSSRRLGRGPGRRDGGRERGGVQLLPHPADRPLHDRRRRELGRARHLPRRRARRRLELAERARARAAEAEQRRREADLAAELARLLLGGGEARRRCRPAAQRIAAAFDLPSAAIELRGRRRRAAAAIPLPTARRRRDAARPARRAGAVLGALEERIAPRSRRCWPPRSSARRSCARSSRRARCDARTSSRPRSCAPSRTTCARR